MEKLAGRGLTGLANVGNSCYLNSCMQILSHTHKLNTFMDSGEYKQKLNRVADSALLLEWDKLRLLMWSENCTIAPMGFVKAVRQIAHFKHREIFTGHSQNDMQEFLLFLIDCFHTALAREVDMHISGTIENSTDLLAKTCYNMMQNMYKKEYSDMLSIFYGIHVSEITHFETGKSLSLMPEPFSLLSLPLPSQSQNQSQSQSQSQSQGPSQSPSPTIFSCLDLYCQKEVLENDNAWFNSDSNQKEKVRRGIVFWSLPTILIIDLKRWHGHGAKQQKVHTLIQTPLSNVDFSAYVRGYNKESYIYDLYGVCNHSGGVLGGHYTAYVKNENGKWYEFNDTAVNEIAPAKVVSQKSYCFFYRKIKG